jgi:opacity protein-like surface antigen
MRVLIMAAAATVLTAAPVFAQTERGYITGLGGFAVTEDNTSGNVLGEVGARIAPHVSVFGDVGKFHNLLPSEVQGDVDNTIAALSANQGLNVLGTGRVPAWYSLGGVRIEGSAGKHVLPYVLGGVGFARLTPTAQFTFSSGTLPDGTTPGVGDDVTTALVNAGDFTAPAATNAAMFTIGGGVDIPVAQHWAVDAGYRYSRVATDTPLNTHGATFGFGYRF